MRTYEVVVIFDADLDDETIRSQVERITDHVAKGDGESGRIDHWGKRRFAYELKHRWEGYYVVVRARAEAAVMEALDRMLTLADEVLRHRVVRVPDNVFGSAEAAPVTAET